MNDPTGGSRAMRLAEQLKELWDKPTTAECLRLSHAGVTEQPAPHPDTRLPPGRMVVARRRNASR